MIKMKNYIKNIGIGVSGILIYFGSAMIKTLPSVLLGININNVPHFLKVTYLISFELLLITLVALLYRDLLTQKWNDLKKHHKKYFHTYFKYWFLLLGLMMLSNALIMLITNDTSGADNQKQVIDMFSNAPIYTYISAVIFAPILEELVFRQSIRMIIPKCNLLFILVSGFVFGGIHVLGASTLTQFLYIMPYSIPGLIFAYVLVKSDNIFNTMGLHFVHNGMLMAMQVIVLLLG